MDYKVDDSIDYKVDDRGLVTINHRIHVSYCIGGAENLVRSCTERCLILVRKSGAENPLHNSTNYTATGTKMVFRVTD